MDLAKLAPSTKWSLLVGLRIGVAGPCYDAGGVQYHSGVEASKAERRRDIAEQDADLDSAKEK